MATIAFKIYKFNIGYCVTIKGKYIKYNDSEIIRKFLQVDINNFNKALNSYGGIYKRLSKMFERDILFFTHKEDIELFVKEYLEPLLVAKQLSI